MKVAGVEVTTNTERFCHICQFWEWDNVVILDKKHISTGHCGLYSATCINEVVAWSRGLSKPIRYQKIEDNI